MLPAQTVPCFCMFSHNPLTYHRADCTARAPLGRLHLALGQQQQHSFEVRLPDLLILGVKCIAAAEHSKQPQSGFDTCYSLGLSGSN